MIIEVLSLPRRHNLNMPQVKGVNLKKGLPINSLPGWESIPLNCKLPMLKCPGNQVIFTKNKIGQSFAHLKQEFDPSGHDHFPEYNPLHDSNLKTFYANERNLKRLRQNGEITSDNDVICTLKDFNEYRQQLHKSQLYYMLNALRQMEREQQDRLLITNAETITTHDHSHLAARSHSFTEIKARKRKIENDHAAQKRRMMQNTLDKFQRIAARKEMQRALREHRKTLNQLKMQQHWDVCADLERKHLINLKKLFQFKKDRLDKNLKIILEKRLKHDTPQEIEMWKKRLQERIDHQVRMRRLLADVAQERQIFIKDHHDKYKEKWLKIQEEIKARSRRNHLKNPLYKAELRKRRRKRKPQPEPEPQPPKRPSQFCYGKEEFNQLVDTEICAALNAALDMDENLQITFEPDDPIYKAAKFMQQHVISKYKKDFSCDKLAMKQVSQRLAKFLEEAKRYVLFRATHVITYKESPFGNTEKLGMSSMGGADGQDKFIKFRKSVSFADFMNTIGQSSYAIHHNVDVRSINDRVPTPTGSLASIVVESKESLVAKTKYNHLCLNDVIFIEHYVTKFKRELIVGMGKIVFAAIRCHMNEKIMDVNHKLLNIDRKYLIKQATKAILSHAINPLNFQSVLKFAISVISTEIIFALQKHFLKPERDPRGIVKPTACTTCDLEDNKLCLFCFH